LSPRQPWLRKKGSGLAQIAANGFDDPLRARVWLARIYQTDGLKGYTSQFNDEFE